MTANPIPRDFPGLIPGTHPLPQEITPVELPPCEPWCESRTDCNTCGYPLCPEHQPEVVRCGEGDGYFHHGDEDCRRCMACDEEAKWDAASERGDAIRGGDVW